MFENKLIALDFYAPSLEYQGKNLNKIAQNYNLTNISKNRRDKIPKLYQLVRESKVTFV